MTSLLSTGRSVPWLLDQVDLQIMKGGGGGERQGFPTHASHPSSQCEWAQKSLQDHPPEMDLQCTCVSRWRWKCFVYMRTSGQFCKKKKKILVCRSTWSAALKQLLRCGCGQSWVDVLMYSYSLSFELQAQLSEADERDLLSSSVFSPHIFMLFTSSPCIEKTEREKCVPGTQLQPEKLAAVKSRSDTQWPVSNKVPPS